MVKYIKAGNYTKIACKALGIGKTTHYTWMERGKKASELEEKGNKIQKSEKIYRDYRDSIRQAEAEAEIRNVTIIQVAAKDDWRAALEILARKYSKRWGRKESIKVEKEVSLAKKESKALKDFLEKEKLMTPEQRKRFIKIAIKYEKELEKESKEYKA